MSGGVFICYRRDDAAGFAGRIYDRLTNALGRENVFIDVDNIPAGLDFVDVLSERVGRCDALIAIIGRSWLASANKNNRRRLDDPSDFVRIEIEAALNRNVPVIPVLIDGAVMPQADDLPDGLKTLARRQGIEISHTSFDPDAARLTDALARIEEERVRLASRGDPKVAVAALAAKNLSSTRDTSRSDATPPAAMARGNGVKLAFALAAGLIILAIGTWLLIRGWPGSPPLAVNPEPSRAGTAPPVGATNAGVQDAKTGAEPPTASEHWVNLQDFRVEYNRRIYGDRMYPDDLDARCQNNVPQRRAHWSPRRAGQFYADPRITSEEDFESDKADMTAKGFKIVSDRVFQSCEGPTRHITGWMKEG